ncbi:unnamed protein product [Ambrosiozyma monospora]|uniref:Unnamed protein product n=1 Tax=Ambrosiozyma monospora TaxID=43982 RepID=A0A9W6YVS7_AMBMO|nr:unnamed protein product [Ambrosiozyma monospora]
MVDPLHIDPEIELSSLGPDQLSSSLSQPQYSPNDNSLSLPTTTEGTTTISKHKHKKKNKYKCKLRKLLPKRKLDGDDDDDDDDTINNHLKSGNPSRDSLSNERTMLAYLRTGISFILLGVAMIQFTKYSIKKGTRPKLRAVLKSDELDDENRDTIEKLINCVFIVRRYGKLIGVWSLIGGVVCFLLGFIRYFRLMWFAFPDLKPDQLDFQHRDKKQNEPQFESGSVFAVTVFAFVFSVCQYLLF